MNRNRSLVHYASFLFRCSPPGALHHRSRISQVRSVVARRGPSSVCVSPEYRPHWNSSADALGGGGGAVSIRSSRFDDRQSESLTRRSRPIRGRVVSTAATVCAESSRLASLFDLFCSDLQRESVSETATRIPTMGCKTIALFVAGPARVRFGKNCSISSGSNCVPRTVAVRHAASRLVRPLAVRSVETMSQYVSAIFKWFRGHRKTDAQSISLGIVVPRFITW